MGSLMVCVVFTELFWISRIVHHGGWGSLVVAVMVVVETQSTMYMYGNLDDTW